MANKPFVSYEVENDKEFQAAINKAIKQIGSLKTPFKLISRDFYKSQTMFDLNRKSAGSYPDFKTEDSREQKENAVGFQYPLLVRTGKLMRSMTRPDGEGSINKITHTEVIIGTEVKNKKGYLYPAVHQYGSKHVPMRKFLFIGPEAKRYATSRQMGRLKRWLGYIEAHVSKKLEINK